MGFSCVTVQLRRVSHYTNLSSKKVTKWHLLWMQHTKTCLVTYLTTNNYGILYFPLYQHYGVAQIRPLADKIFYSSKATMHINSHTKFQLSNSITSWDMESSICYWFNIGPRNGFLPTRCRFFGVFWVFLAISDKIGVSEALWFFAAFYYKFSDDTKFHGTETAVVKIFILLLFHLLCTTSAFSLWHWDPADT